MTKQEIEKAYVQYDALLHHLSHQCSRRCGRPEPDVYGQACYLFMLAATSHDQCRGNFGTYLFSCVRNGLNMWGQKNQLPLDPDCMPERKTTLDPAHLVGLKDRIENLPDECREVAMIILDGPAEVLGIGLEGCKKITAHTIKNYLRGRGWSWPKIWNTMRVLKVEVRAL